MSKLEDFKLLKIIGVGGSGTIFAAEHNRKMYVMKTVRKEKARCSFLGITEKNILKRINHQFIIEFYSCFTTKTRLCYVLEYAPGGDLMYYLYTKNWKLPLPDVKFYGAEVSLAISFLHSNGILHRDITLRNILIGKDGHIKLTDFGTSAEKQLEGGTNAMKGTLSFMAPEVLKQELYSYEIDWWSFGVCLYLMLYGEYPFNPDKKSSRDIIDNFKNKISFPQTIPATAITFIEGLLEKDPNERLGKHGFKQISSHAFFRNIDWEKIEKKEIKPPFKPNVKSSTDFCYFDPSSIKNPCSLTNDLDWEDPNFEDFDYVNPNWNK